MPKLKAKTFEEIRPHDKLTILVHGGMRMDGTRDHTKKTGRVVMRSGDRRGWVVNLGGPHGTPGLAYPENTVAINGHLC